MYYTGKFNVKYMVQSRQLRSQHVDSHYAAAGFKYIREFSIKFNSFCTFLSLDDKHQIKLGEPGYPVAAVERGRQVLVSADKPFSVGDHDFTKFKITPSVALKIDIPDSIDKSFYDGQVYTTLKNTILQPCSPMRNMAEISQIIVDQGKPILVVFSDGGGDHRLTFLSVQLGFVSLFVKYKLAYIVAGRCAPCQSYIDPVERVMSLLNLGLQTVGVMRQEMPKGFEKQIGNANSMSDIRSKINQNNALKNEIEASIKPSTDLLGSVLGRLSWKGKPMKMQEPASELEIDNLFGILQQLEPAFDKQKMQQKHLRAYPVLQRFIETHCQRNHYLFTMKRCKDGQCVVCSISEDDRTPTDLLDSLHPLPLPVPDEGDQSDHYRSFEQVIILQFIHM